MTMRRLVVAVSLIAALLLGSGKYSAGPSAVALTIQGPWVIGALVNNQWSFAGWGKDEFNELLLQPFGNYNFGKGWYLVSAPILTANWDAAKGNQWTVPLGVGGGRTFRLRALPGGDHLGDLGKLPVNVSLQGYANAVRPDFAANWLLRFQIQFLFPK